MAYDDIGVSGTIPPLKDDFYFPVDIRLLRMDAITDFDLYTNAPDGGGAVLCHSGDNPFSEENLSALLERGITHLLVARAQHGEYLQYLDAHLAPIINDLNVPDISKSRVLYDSAEDLVKGLMEEDPIGLLLKKTDVMTQHFVHRLQSGHNALRQLIKTMSFDYYTYTHSVNVFIFSISLALEARCAAEDVIRFGQGVLVHDIGKRKVGSEILNHRGKLSQTQWDSMRKHPEYGVEILNAEGATDPIMLDVVLHHHEKLNGTGYPEGLSGAQVLQWARICAIADIFDALTTRRAHQQAISSYESLALMNREMVDELDPNLLKLFMHMMGHVREN